MSYLSRLYLGVSWANNCHGCHQRSIDDRLLVKIISHLIDLSGMGDADDKIEDHPPRDFLASYILVVTLLASVLGGSYIGISTCILIIHID